MSQQDLVDLVFSKERGRGETFWQEISEYTINDASNLSE